jgi:hypothetical protein
MPRPLLVIIDDSDAAHGAAIIWSSPSGVVCMHCWRVNGTGLVSHPEGPEPTRPAAHKYKYKSRWPPSTAYTSLTHDLLPISVSSHQPLHREHRRMRCDRVSLARPGLCPARLCRVAFTVMELINDVRRLLHCDALSLPAPSNLRIVDPLCQHLLNNQTPLHPPTPQPKVLILKPASGATQLVYSASALRRCT